MEVIKSEREKGRNFINKLSVGERQLAAAIRMYFLELDPLAIHTVSAAAHNLLADLLKDRGRDASVHGIIHGLLRAAKDLHEGVITEDHIRGWGDGALELVQQYCHLFEADEGFDIDEISSSAPTEFAKAYWSDRRRSYNYLKHADRDAKALLDEASINNEDTILQAIICSQHLNMKHTAEKHFFYCAMIALEKIKGNGSKPFDLELMMSGLTKEEIMALGRGNLCHARYPDDEDYKESSSQKMLENCRSLEGKDVQFFKLD
jgi:hypothetical protein